MIVCFNASVLFPNKNAPRNKYFLDKILVKLGDRKQLCECESKLMRIFTQNHDVLANASSSYVFAWVCFEIIESLKSMWDKSTPLFQPLLRKFLEADALVYFLVVEIWKGEPTASDSLAPSLLVDEVLVLLSAMEAELTAMMRAVGSKPVGALN